MGRFKNLGHVIRAMRREKGWSQTELADRAGVSLAMISNYERGIREPSLSSLGSILDAFGVYLGSLDDRLNLANDREPDSDAARLPGAPEGVNLHRYLGYAKLPPDLVPAFSEMVAGFQVIARHLAARALADRR